MNVLCRSYDQIKLFSTNYSFNKYIDSRYQYEVIKTINLSTKGGDHNLGLTAAQ